MKIALVTGASSGIGSSTAIRLAARGNGVILTYNSNREGAEATVATIEDAGGSAVALPLDAGRSETFPAFAEQVRAELSGRWQRQSFDYLVNNAGLSGAAAFEETGEELFDELYRVLLKGPYFLTQKLLPAIADGGAVVIVGSTAALSTGASPGYSAYAAMKGGVVTMTRYLAKELSPRGIRVNSVAPGPTRTRLGNDGFERFPEAIPPLVEETALARLGEPDDIANAIAALLSPECGWITAETIEVSGGFQL